MPYTVSDLISKAYYLSGIVSKDFETVSGPQYAEGLDVVNDILGDQTSDKSMITYFTTQNFTGIVGQEAYFISGLVEATSLVFFLSSVRYSMNSIDRDSYFGLPRAESIQSLPFTYHVERGFNTNLSAGPIGPGATIYVYFLPNQPYLFQIWGKFALPSVTLNQDLSLTIDRFYIDYLKYQTAQRLCNDYNYEVPPSVSVQLAGYLMQISKRSAIIDLSCRKVSTLNETDTQINYAQVNLGKGWTVP